MAVNMNIVSPDFAGSTFTFYKNKPFTASFQSTVPAAFYQSSGSEGGLVDLCGSYTSATGYSTAGTGTLVVDGLRWGADTSLVAGNGTGVITNGPALTAGLGRIVDVVDVSSGAVLVFTDPDTRRVRQLAGGNVTNLAGSGSTGYLDGSGTVARFPVDFRGITADASGFVYVADFTNRSIRQISPDGVVTTVAGAPPPTPVTGYLDGIGTSSLFTGVEDVAYDPTTGCLFVADGGNRRIRKLAPGTSGFLNCIVTTYAGNGSNANVDSSVGLSASIANPRSLAVNSLGELFVGEGLTHTIRKISPVFPHAVTLFAGTFNVSGFVDGVGSNARFNDVRGLSFDSNDNLYVADRVNNAIRKITPAGVVTTLAGTGVAGYIEGIGNVAQFNSPNGLRSVGSNVYVCDQSNRRIRQLTLAPEVRPGGSRPTGYNIVSTTNNLTVNVLPRLGISVEFPPVVSNTAQLYKYEPFLYQYFKYLAGDSIQVLATPEVLPFLSTTTNDVTYGSSNGYGLSYLTPFLFTVQVTSNSTVVDSRSFNVFVGNGRFFPPASNSAYVFYRNEPVASTYGAPIEFDTSAAITQVFTTPTIPAGLTFTQGDACGNKFLLGGTPVVQIPAANYQFIGKNTFTGRVVTTTVSITVSGERVRVDLSGSSNVTGMTVGTPIGTRALTSRYPTVYGSGDFRYEWTNTPPDGLVFADSTGTPIPLIPAFFQPSDASTTLLIQGTPTLAAANTLAAAGGSAYTTNITARILGGPSNVIPFTFSFGETVLFTSGAGVPTTPTVRDLYVGEVLTGTNNIRFFAKTFFTSNVNISGIFSPDLRADLSLAYSGSQAYLFTPTSVSYVSSDIFTLRAVNSNGITRDVPLSITTLPDVVSFDYSITPSNGTTYTFIVSRPLANAKLGFYTSPIQFRATAPAAASPSDIVYTTTSLPDGITTSLVNNNLRLVGTPTTPTALGPFTVTASNVVTGATASTSINLSVLADVFTFSATPAFPTLFLQNEPMDPVVVSASTLSERSIVSYGSSGLPPGITMSPFGTMQGTPTLSTSGTLSYAITATTGYQTGSYNVSYSVTPDAILFTVPQSRYTIAPGDPVPPIQYSAVTYSGLNVSNFTLDLSSFGALTTFGVTLATNGTFGGTMTTSLPPDPILPPSNSPVPYLVTAQAPNVSGTTFFLIGADNPYVARSYAILGNSPGCNAIYFTDIAISNVGPDAYTNYTQWYPLSVGTPSNAWFSDIAIRGSVSSNGLTSNVTILAVANNISTGYIMRSTDGIHFDTTTLPTGVVITSIAYDASSSIWYGAGVQSNDGTQAFLFSSTDDGVTWPLSNAESIGCNILAFNQLQTRIGSNGPFETFGTRVLVDGIASNYGTGNQIVVAGGRQYNGGFTTLAHRDTAGGAWDGQFGVDTGAETNGYLYLGGADFFVWGSDFYRTGDADLSFIGPTTTMTGWTSSGNKLNVIFGFNVICYDVQKFGNFWVALGIHYYTGLGFRMEIRYSEQNPPTSDIRGPYNVLNVIGLYTSYSPTRPIPPFELGPMFSDGSQVLIQRRSGGVNSIYSHPLSDPDFTANWSAAAQLFFNSAPGETMGSSGAPPNPDIIKITPPVRISTGTLQPYIQFLTETGPSFLPYASPVFTSPTETEYNLYQYVPISPIQVTAVPGGGPGTGGPIYLFIRDQDLPAGLRFNPLTGVISGTPFEAFERRQIPVYAYDNAARALTGDIVAGPYSRFILTMSSRVPRVVRQQTSAGAYTSLVRQYTEVNAAQNARDSRVYPAAERALGEFMSPPAPDVVTQTVDPRCFDPNACGSAPTS